MPEPKDPAQLLAEALRAKASQAPVSRTPVAEHTDMTESAPAAGQDSTEQPAADSASGEPEGESADPSAETPSRAGQPELRRPRLDLTSEFDPELLAGIDFDISTEDGQAAGVPTAPRREHHRQHEPHRRLGLGWILALAALLGLAAGAIVGLLSTL